MSRSGVSAGPLRLLAGSGPWKMAALGLEPASDHVIRRCIASMCCILHGLASVHSMMPWVVDRSARAEKVESRDDKHRTYHPTFMHCFYRIVSIYIILNSVKSIDRIQLKSTVSHRPSCTVSSYGKRTDIVKPLLAATTQPLKHSKPPFPLDETQSELPESASS